MRKTLTRILPLAAMMLVLLFVLSATAFAAGDPTDEPGTTLPVKLAAARTFAPPAAARDM